MRYPVEDFTAETVYDDDWCREHQLLDRQPAREPDEIAAPDECVVTSWTRCSQVRDPLGRDVIKAGVR